MTLKLFYKLTPIALLIALGWPLYAAGNSDRIALVTGNGASKNVPLRNPVNDANDMAAALKEYKFEYRQLALKRNIPYIGN
jgi:hypothetical protein